MDVKARESMRRAAGKVAELFYNRLLGVRIAVLDELDQMVGVIANEIAETYINLFNEPPHLPDNIQVQIGNLPPGKAGGYKYPGENPYGTLIISEETLKGGPQWVRLVVIHELCHAMIGDNVKDDHGAKFKTLATAVGLPEKLQD